MMENIEMVARRWFQYVARIPVQDIMQRQEVRTLCAQNSCGNYGKSWSCPSAAGSLQELPQRFRPFTGFLVLSQVYALQDSFDWKGMQAGVASFRQALRNLRSELSRSYPKREHLVLGVGACDCCPLCAHQEGEPCRNPDQAMVSLEACGIDVMQLMREHDLPYTHGANTVTYIGGLFYLRECEPLRHFRRHSRCGPDKGTDRNTG